MEKTSSVNDRVGRDKCSDKEEGLSWLSEWEKKEKLEGWMRYDGVDGIH